MKIFSLVPIVLASSLLIADSAIASKLQEIYSDNKPRLCEISVKGKLVGACSSFKFLKEDGLYVFSFDSKEKGKIGFVAIAADVKKETGTTIAIFAVGRFYYGGKVYDTTKNSGVCATTELYKQYTYARCSVNDIEVQYYK
jgi:hypothetical protein